MKRCRIGNIGVLLSDCISLRSRPLDATSLGVAPSLSQAAALDHESVLVVGIARQIVFAGG
jgi:hypothetical protein